MSWRSRHIHLRDSGPIAVMLFYGCSLAGIPLAFWFFLFALLTGGGLPRSRSDIAGAWKLVLTVGMPITYTYLNAAVLKFAERTNRWATVILLATLAGLMAWAAIIWQYSTSHPLPG